MDSSCIFLGIKVKPGPIERFKLENFALDNTVENLKTEAEKKAVVPSASLELIHHGKILKENTTLQDNGVKYGEMVHVVKKKEDPPARPVKTYTNIQIQALNISLRALGCTPNSPGWTRSMQNLASFLLSQLLNDESVMNGILDVAPSLGEDCVALSILHEVELLAALGANMQTMRRGAEAHPDLPAALMHLSSQQHGYLPLTATPSGTAISGFAYSLEALSEEEDAYDDESEEAVRSNITQEQLAAALQSASDAVAASTGRSPRQQNFLQMLRGGDEQNRGAPALPTGLITAAAERVVITTQMFNEALTQAMNAGASSSTPMEQSTEASTGVASITAESLNEAITDAINRRATAVVAPMERSTAASSSNPEQWAEQFVTQLTHMHEMGLLDDNINVRALLMCSGDVNAAINLVFSGAIVYNI